MATKDVISILGNELQGLEGIRQNLDTGASLDQGDSYIGSYTNRLFGAPFQFLDSVDRRFPNINANLGNEFLRNIMLDSPILHIRPGMPKYTGGSADDDFMTSIKKIGLGSSVEGMSFAKSLLTELSKKTIFGGGSLLQKRMFGFRETYYEYTQHANYMCRCVAEFMELTTGTEFPNGVFMANNSFQTFSDARWENYRMIGTTTVDTPLEYLGKLGGAAVDQYVEGIKATGKTIETLVDLLNPFDDESMTKKLSETKSEIAAAWSDWNTETMTGTMANKVTEVQFMVEPCEFTEELANRTEPSMIEQMVDTVNQGLGSEIAFITNSSVEKDLIEKFASFLGSASDTAVKFLGPIVETVGGGFSTSLFKGAFQAIKGQKMIYPDIYKSSESRMDHRFSITFTTPYGDPYNYYINIVVPVLHLIALTAPRMVTSNSITSPYLVQAFIPGMCTCQLGIIEALTLTKNPTGKHVSVDGFPLTVKASFTIKELYNAMSISPADDPASFLFNETLSDYMCNMAGLIPSMDTFSKQHKSSFQNLDNYLSIGGIGNEIVGPAIDAIEDLVNPYVGR